MLVERALFVSRSRAQAAIIAGDVTVNGRPVDKPGALFDDNCRIEIKESREFYVSRGGRKLAAALAFFGINVEDRVVLDGGSSTGGFTDCLIKRGARKVIAVDVGYGQLAWELRRDSRVELHERVNLRYLKPEQISEPASLATVDVAFISVAKVVPAISRCLISDGRLLLLIKPQFEVGRGQVGKGGVIRNPDLHRRVLSDLSKWMIGFGFSVKGIKWSPILGAKGNIEFWLYLAKGKAPGYVGDELERLIDNIVVEAHECFEQ